MAAIRIGIIGTGGMANAHATVFKGIPGVQLAACLDVVPGRAEAFAAKHGIALATQDQAKLLATVDAVSVVTPDRFHAAPTIAALKAGKHVLCEKPLTVTLDEARDVQAAHAARPDLIGMVNFSYRRSAAFQEAIKVVDSGKLGALRHVNAMYLQSWLASPMWGHWSSDSMLWRLQTAAGSGGVLSDIGVHILDLTTAVAGDVARVRCDLRTYPKVQRGERYTTWKGKQLDANDSAVVQLEFADGAMGVMQTSRWATGHKNHLRLEVHGTAGAVQFDLDDSYERLHLCVGKDIDTATWKVKELKSAPNIWDRFIRAIKRGKAEQPDIARGATVQAMLDACIRSAATGAWEAIPELTMPRRRTVKARVTTGQKK